MSADKNVSAGFELVPVPALTASGSACNQSSCPITLTWSGASGTAGDINGAVVCATASACNAGGAYAAPAPASCGPQTYTLTLSGPGGTTTASQTIIVSGCARGPQPKR
jgi:hypothetical protein